MSGEKLADAIGAVDWNKNVSAFLDDVDAGAACLSANLRIAVWARQFENLDKGNPALSYVREMQLAGQYVVALMGLALYRPAAASMRSMLEAALYYTYFRSHPAELTTLVRDSSYFVDKRDVLDFHKKHTPNFTKLQEKFGLVSKLENWYGSISAVIHGQMPGAWVTHSAISEIEHVGEMQKLALENFIKVEDVIYRLFLCTVGLQLWDNFSTASKKFLLKNLSGELKTFAGLDAA
jgi:hypothetical protein